MREKSGNLQIKVHSSFMSLLEVIHQTAINFLLAINNKLNSLQDVDSSHPLIFIRIKNQIYPKF